MNNFVTSAAIAAGISFLITLILGKLLIPFLKKLKFGQTILEIGPSWHKTKQGTPTMGGISFMIGITVASIIGITFYYGSYSWEGIQIFESPLMLVKIFAGLIMAVLYGLIGFADDYIKVVKKVNKGLTALQKLILQFLTVGAYFYTLYSANEAYGTESITIVKLPFIGSFDLGFFYWILAALVLVGIVNAANLSDGVDGLCASVAFFIGIAYMIITSLLGMFGLSVCSAAVAGGCIGFLFWNFHPAKMFMGDTGSLFLGGIICAIGFGTGLPVLLIVLTFMYIFEMFSVILQVIYFKITKGKRLFKMSPLHHHFEMLGWSEVKICTVFSILTVLLGIIASLAVIYGL